MGRRKASSRRCRNNPRTATRTSKKVLLACVMATTTMLTLVLSTAYEQRERPAAVRVGSCCARAVCMAPCIVTRTPTNHYSSGRCCNRTIVAGAVAAIVAFLSSNLKFSPRNSALLRAVPVDTQHNQQAVSVPIFHLREISVLRTCENKLY